MKQRRIFIFALALSLLLMVSCGKTSGPPEHIATEQPQSSNTDASSPNGFGYEITPAAERKDIDTATGVVLELKESEILPSQVLLTREEAKQKALAHAGVNAADATFVECKPDHENGRTVYEIEFYSGNKEYDYEVDAYSGDILAYDHDAENYAPPPRNDDQSSISADEALKLALAKVPGAQLKDIREFEIDRDDGRLEYEGTIVYQEKEYEFEIDGHSGAIRSWDVESVYD